MKNIFNIKFLFFLFIVFNNNANAQKKIKEGIVRFVLKPHQDNQSNDLDFMKGTTLDCYFRAKEQRMDMKMMGGMMRIQTMLSSKKKNGILLMDMMGQKFQIVGLNNDQVADYNNFMYLNNVDKIIYHKKNKKKILGYKCYLAEVINRDGSSVSYYISKKIHPPFSCNNDNTKSLEAYPLEIILDIDSGNKMIFTATEICKTVSPKDFEVEEGYTKMTLKEYEKKMEAFGKK